MALVVCVAIRPGDISIKEGLKDHVHQGFHSRLSNPLDAIFDVAR